MFIEDVCRIKKFMFICISFIIILVTTAFIGKIENIYIHCRDGEIDVNFGFKSTSIAEKLFKSWLFYFNCHL